MNNFVDKRFGEYDNDMSLEERMLKRFTLEKQVSTLFLGIFQCYKCILLGNFLHLLVFVIPIWFEPLYLGII